MLLMKITLEEARLILDDKKELLRNLFSERSKIIENVYTKNRGETNKKLTHEPHLYTMDYLMTRIAKVQKDIRILKKLMQYQNSSVYIDFKDESTNENITLYEAILLTEQMRNELERIKDFGNMKKTSQEKYRCTSSADSRNLYEYYEESHEPTFDTRKMRDLYNKNVKILRKLELLIGDKNFTATIELPKNFEQDSEIGADPSIKTESK